MTTKSRLKTTSIIGLITLVLILLIVISGCTTKNDWKETPIMDLNLTNTTVKNTTTATPPTINETTTTPITPKVCNNLALKSTFSCDTKIKGYECSNLNDNNLTSMWFSSYVCSSGRSPCSILTYVTVNSTTPFNTIVIYNRPEPQFFINRVLIDYNEIKGATYVGGYDYSMKPWPIVLNESTTSAKIKIPEVFGTGKNFPTGIAEIRLYNNKECTE
jgi:hypothetical protein